MDDSKVMTFGEFRRMFRLCPKGHKKGISTNDSCWTCREAERQEACLHDGARYWRNPSNLPGDNRFVCNACGKSGLPAPLDTRHADPA